MNPLPPKGSSPRTLNLFEVTITVPTPPSDRAAPAQLTDPASMSDAQLAKHLGQLVKEVQHRMEAGRGSRPQLQAAAQQARSTLDRLVPRPAKQAKGSRSSKTSPVLQEGQRKAVQAALLAGVAPAQVAKHFGMSLAAVRKTLDETA